MFEMLEPFVGELKIISGAVLSIVNTDSFDVVCPTVSVTTNLIVCVPSVNC